MYECAKSLATYKCQRCPNYRTTKFAFFKKHIDAPNMQCQNELKYRCLICHFKTYSKYLAIRHRMFVKCSPITTIVAKEESSSDVQQETTLSTDVPECAKRKRHEVFECDECPLQFSLKSFLLRHVFMSHPAPENTERFECDKCPSKYTGKCDLKTPIRQRQFTEDPSKLILKPDIIADDSENIHWFECDQCPLKYKYRHGLLRHKNNKHNSSRNKWLRRTTIDHRRILEKHKMTELKNRLKGRKLENCSSIKNRTLRRDRRLLKLKSKSILETPKISENIHWFGCDQCPLKYKYHHSLARHKNNKHNTNKKNWLRPITIDHRRILEKHKITERKLKNRSSIKNRTLRRDRRLLKLKSQSISETIHRFKCEQCTSEYKSLQNLITHQREKHPVKRFKRVGNWFKCDQCSLKYKWDCGLKRHKAQKHSALPSSKLTLEKRKDAQHTEKINCFECDQCPSKYKWEHDLRKHKFTKHAGTNSAQHRLQEQPVQFESTVRKENITWFKCEQCWVKYKTAKSLRRHKVEKHVVTGVKRSERLQSLPTITLESVEKEHSRAKTPTIRKKKWFECDRCPLKYKTEYSLRRHELAKHSEEISKSEDIDLNGNMSKKM